MIRIASTDAASLSQDFSWWALYEASFPECEREPQAVIVSSVRSGRALALRACRSDETIGLGVAYLLRGMPFVFVAYLAVAKPFRGHGLGAGLLDAMGALGAERLRQWGTSSRGIVLEVDDPTLASTPEARSVCLSRIRFFEAQGGRLLATPYLQPAIDGATVVPMKLMVFDRNPLDPFPVAESRELIRAMYLEKYGPTNGIPPHVLTELMNGYRSLT